jgi:hypothetical protein
MILSLTPAPCKSPAITPSTISISDIAARLSSLHPALVPQIAKALASVLAGQIFEDPDDSMGQGFVAISSRNPAQGYLVSANACTCPARGVCYHRIGRRLLLLQRIALAAATSESTPAPDPAPKPPRPPRLAGLVIKRRKRPTSSEALEARCREIAEENERVAWKVRVGKACASREAAHL